MCVHSYFYIEISIYFNFFIYLYNHTFILGYLCEQQENFCENGGTCIENSTVSATFCSCLPGYSGSHCQERALLEAFCSENSCLNGATCLDSVNGVFCSCVSGYRGNFMAFLFSFSCFYIFTNYLFIILQFFLSD